MRLPLNQVGSLNKIKAFARFEQEHERTRRPRAGRRLELPKEKVTDTLRVAGRHLEWTPRSPDSEDNSCWTCWSIQIRPASAADLSNGNSRPGGPRVGKPSRTVDGDIK